MSAKNRHLLTRMKRMRSVSGMSILEMVAIVTVLSVVAAITFPKFQRMLYQSREGRTKANLGDIRGAIAIYYSDHYGLFPSDNGLPETRLSKALVPTYLEVLPAVDLLHLYKEKLNTVNDRLDDGGDWVYGTLEGHIYVNSTRLDTEEQPISGW